MSRDHRPGRAGRVLLVLLLAGLLLPAVGLTVVRLLESERGTLVRLVSFTPLALPAYAVGGLVLAVVVVRGVLGARRAGRRRPWVAATALAVTVAGTVLHGWWLAPSFSGGPPVPDGERLTVMTSNLLEGEGDGLALVREASAADVDVLVLTEVTAPVLEQMDAAGLDDLLPHRIGEARPAGLTDGTMLLSREPLGEPERLPTDLQSWAVEVGEGDDALTVLAVHPVAPLSPGLWRVEHARILEAAQRRGADLVVGDFNATLDHRPMQALVEAGWRSAAEEADAGWQPTWPANGLFGWVPAPALIQIDHVMTGPDLGGLAVRTVDLEGTDHRAVVAELARR